MLLVLHTAFNTQQRHQNLGIWLKTLIFITHFAINQKILVTFL